MTAIQSITTATTSLYEQDFYLWLQTNINLLKEGNFAEIDLENLLEELESMGRSDQNALKSNLRIILMHLLKYKYQSKKQTNSWLYTIREHRIRLEDTFKTSPSLYRFFEDIFNESYQDARELAAAETGLSIQIFPLESPFTTEEVLNPDFLPTDNDTAENGENME
jgi:predicted DNA-binding ribbon-helix-helix protein